MPSASRRRRALGEIRPYLACSQNGTMPCVVGDAFGAVAPGRVHVPLELPFNWGPRPPSINRLLGVIWLAYVLPGKPFDESFYGDVTRFFETFYHVTPTRAQLQKLVSVE